MTADRASTGDRCFNVWIGTGAQHRREPARTEPHEISTSPRPVLLSSKPVNGSTNPQFKHLNAVRISVDSAREFFESFY
jgi:hypothetical protein